MADKRILIVTLAINVYEHEDAEPGELDETSALDLADCVASAFLNGEATSEMLAGSGMFVEFDGADVVSASWNEAA